MFRRTAVLAVRAPDRSRLLPILAAAVMLVLASVLAVSAGVRAGQPVTCSVLVSSTSSPVPAESATVFVGEQGTITGSGFTPDTELVIEITIDGLPEALFALTTDGSGGFVLTGEIQPDQIGVLVLTATETDVCSDSVTVTILAAPLPSASGLPDAAMAVEDRWDEGTAFAIGLFIVTAVGLAVVSARSRRPV